MSSRALWLLLALGLVPVADAATKARILETVAPVYPESSRRAFEHGNVLVKVSVTKTGTVSDVSIAKSSGFPALDSSALEAVRQWKFTPATDEIGAATEGTLQFNVRFDLEEPAAASAPSFDPETKLKIEDEWRGLIDLSTLVDRLTRRCGALLKTNRNALERYPEFFDTMAAELSPRDAWLRTYFKDHPKSSVDAMLLSDRQVTGMVVNGVLDQLVGPGDAGKSNCVKLTAAAEAAMQTLVATKSIDWNAPDVRLIKSFHESGIAREPLQPKR